MIQRPSRRLILSLTSLSAWAGTAGAACWMAFSYLLPEDLTRTGAIYSRLAVVAFFGRVFTFHTGVALAAAAVVGLVLRRRRLLTVAGLAAAACLTPTVAACLPKRRPAVAGPTLRVMSINLEYTNTQYAAILAGIRKNDPDVVVMEEFTQALDDNLAPALSSRYPFQCLRPSHGGSGLAMFSRRPFTEPPRPDTFKQRSQIRAVVRVADRPVVLYAVHPASPISTWAIVRNRLQTVDYLQQFRAERSPIIAAGDWNFTGETANAAALRSAGLTDAFDQSGFARGSTWPVRPRWKSWLPGVRIDHVFMTPQLACARYAACGFDGSDHLPIVADVGIVASGG